MRYPHSHCPRTRMILTCTLVNACMLLKGHQTTGLLVRWSVLLTLITLVQVDGYT